LLIVNVRGMVILDLSLSDLGTLRDPFLGDRVEMWALLDVTRTDAMKADNMSGLIADIDASTGALER
jgi:hypothetical protein